MGYTVQSPAKHISRTECLLLWGPGSTYQLATAEAGCLQLCNQPPSLHASNSPRSREPAQILWLCAVPHSLLAWGCNWLERDGSVNFRAASTCPPLYQWASSPVTGSQRFRCGYWFCTVLILDAEFLWGQGKCHQAPSNTENHMQVVLRKGNKGKKPPKHNHPTKPRHINLKCRL